MFIFTLTSVIVALTGTPAIVRLAVAATLLPSGIGTLIAPEFTVTLPGTGGEPEVTVKAVPLIPATPPQLTGGVTTIVGLGLTVKVAQFDTLVGGMNGVQVPPSTQRYAYPLIN
jgi:hypothetical protein